MLRREKLGNNLWGCQTWQNTPLPTEISSQPLVYDFLYTFYPQKNLQIKISFEVFMQELAWFMDSDDFFFSCVCAGGGEGGLLGSEPRTSHLLNEHFTTECIPSHHHTEYLTQEGVSHLMD